MSSVCVMNSAFVCQFCGCMVLSVLAAVCRLHRTVKCFPHDIFLSLNKSGSFLRSLKINCITLSDFNQSQRFENVPIKVHIMELVDRDLRPKLNFEGI